MKDRAFADFLVGALACVSVLGMCAMLGETELGRSEARSAASRREAERWALPRKQRRRRSPEDDCRHCSGCGVCEECAPGPCRVCVGTGLQPRDAATAQRLAALWDGAA